MKPTHQRMIGKKLLCGAAAFFIIAASAARPVQAWSHQAHILMTRMAVLRIIEDPTAPKELRDFLRGEMKADRAACEKLALEEVVGTETKAYEMGLDGMAILPDLIPLTEAGKKPLEGYGMPEGAMHFLDLEYFGKEIAYAPDMSNRPKVEEFPHDVKDWRYKHGGFVPFRVEECYGKVVEMFGAGEKRDAKETTRWVGFMAHYLEDCEQPHHATIDYKSLSYLAGKVKGVEEVKTPKSDGGTAISYRTTKEINPHADIEFKLFEDPKAVGFRKEYWKELNARIDKHAKEYGQMGVTLNGGTMTMEMYDPFRRTLKILSNSYSYLPAVGKAAQAAYAKGAFDAEAFFTSEDTVNGEKLTMVQLIAEQNARGVLEVEQAIRWAWLESRMKTGGAANWPAATQPAATQPTSGPASLPASAMDK